MPTRREKLAYHLARQRDFCAGYAPLYHRLFGLLADWCTAEAHDPLVAWLAGVAPDRQAFDIPNLLMAGLHEAVLAGETAMADLARAYPTAGGRPDALDDDALAAALRAAILARRDPLTAFIETANIQTNETGRGLAWLLPAGLLRWPALHLVDIGASAGLNLVADWRAYILQDGDGRPRHQLGQGRPPQFVVHVRAGARTLDALDDALPPIVARDGLDIAPVEPRDAAVERHLQSYIWPDQPRRLARLREGLAARRANDAGGTPVRLHRVALPDELPAFLDGLAPAPGAGVLLYNTYLTQYLPERGRLLRAAVAEWAARQAQPVLWLQWEPARGDDERPPERDWLAWTADRWLAGAHDRWRIGWVHPHGRTGELAADWRAPFEVDQRRRIAP